MGWVVGKTPWPIAASTGFGLDHFQRRLSPAHPSAPAHPDLVAIPVLRSMPSGRGRRGDRSPGGRPGFRASDTGLRHACPWNRRSGTVHPGEVPLQPAHESPAKHPLDRPAPAPATRPVSLLMERGRADAFRELSGRLAGEPDREVGSPAIVGGRSPPLFLQSRDSRTRPGTRSRRMPAGLSPPPVPQGEQEDREPPPTVAGRSSPGRTPWRCRSWPATGRPAPTP